MPSISVKDYTWRQNHNFIIISTPLVGHPKKIDLFAIDHYVKASYAPFILELFLWGSIMEESSECTIGDEAILFTLRKKEAGVEWPSLLTDHLDKEKKRALRSRALENARLNAEERAKARSAKKQSLQRQAVKAQIDLDTRQFNKIDALRNSHRKEAMEDLEEWRSRAEKPILENIAGIPQENRNAYRPPVKWFEKDRVENSENREPEVCEKGEVPPVVETSSSFSCSTLEDDPEGCDDAKTFRSASEGSDEQVRREMTRRKKREEENRGKEIVRRVLSSEKSRFLGKSEEGIFEENGVAIPRPRKSCTIDVKFTDRVFPTPARESQRLEEQEWLEKQAEARRKSGFVSEDLRPEEQDPQWLKEKGDEFFKAGNYLGAISAYSHGIKLSDKMSSLYVNRSAAHYASGNYQRCAEDSSKALELMVPKCEANRESRARCHARLGAALCKLAAPQHGIPELEAALKLAPENESVKRDLNVAKKYFEMND